MDMRRIINLLEATDSGSNKLTVNAFIYLPPKGDKDEFAQCSTCQLFLPGKERCGIFGKNDKVVANASCGLYLHGKPHDDQPISGAVTPEQAGYVLGQVRCENCVWFKDSACDLFKLLNEKMPDAFDLTEKVNAKGCCNAFQSK